MTIDTTKLRELAMKATPGPWESNLCSIDKIWFRGRIQECVMQSNGSVLAIMAEDSANSDYVAAANPATVLQLLDELERTQGSVAIVSAALSAAERELQRLRPIESAVENLKKAKGRHNTEIAYKRLMEAHSG